MMKLKYILVLKWVNLASDTYTSILILERIADIPSDSLNVSAIVSPAIAIFDIN